MQDPIERSCTVFLYGFVCLLSDMAVSRQRKVDNCVKKTALVFFLTKNYNSDIAKRLGSKSFGEFAADFDY